MRVAFDRAEGQSLSSFRRLVAFELQYSVRTGENYFGQQLFSHVEMADAVVAVSSRLRAQGLGNEVMELEPVFMG